MNDIKQDNSDKSQSLCSNSDIGKAVKHKEFENDIGNTVIYQLALNDKQTLRGRGIEPRKNLCTLISVVEK